MSFRFNGEMAKENIKKAFNLLDEDKNEEISVADLKKIVKELGEDLDEEEIQNIIEKNDVNGDGKLTLEDFENVMTKKTLE